MKKKFKPCAVFLAGLLSLALILPADARAQTFHITDAAAQTVRFFADHSLGEVDGTLTLTDGTLTFDHAGPTHGLTGHFTADMTSFDSGIGLRDKDMRKKYLNTDTYPEAVFTLNDALPTLLDGASGDTLRLAVAGSMTLHGVTRNHTVEATLTPTPEGYRVLPPQMQDTFQSRVGQDELRARIGISPTPDSGLPRLQSTPGLTSVPQAARSTLCFWHQRRDGHRPDHIALPSA